MSFVVVISAALIVATLTLFSGFGLGTLLMPVFALFFSLPVAVAATAVVHLVNNLFKLALVGRWANLGIVLSFALPAALAAVAGASLLVSLSHVEPLAEYTLGGRQCVITGVKLVIAALILTFTLLEWMPGFRKAAFGTKSDPGRRSAVRILRRPVGPPGRAPLRLPGPGRPGEEGVPGNGGRVRSGRGCDPIGGLRRDGPGRRTVGGRG